MDEKPPLTPPQADVLEFIQQCCDRHGMPPSYREIQAHLGYKAVGTIQDHVKALIRKGYLEKVSLRGKRARKARGLLPAGYQREAVKRIPVYGEIAAGVAREAPQIELGSLVVSETSVKDPCFALRVVGNSMVDAGIFEGDYLIVERSAKAKNGDIVVALLNGETTVKRYLQKLDEIFLIPENRQMKPIKVGASSFEIQGRVVGLQRKLK